MQFPRLENSALCAVKTSHFTANWAVYGLEADKL